jgi:hypothetical protein
MFDGKPVGLDDAAEDHAHSTQQERRDDEVPRQVPAASQNHRQDDREREHEQSDERSPPQRARPAEHRGQRVCDVRVLLDRRPSDDRGQRAHDRGPEHEPRVDRAPVSPSRLG